MSIMNVPYPGPKPFVVIEENGAHCVVSEQHEDFAFTLKDGRAAYYAAELLNRGFAMGH